jgi:hypothetical protein
VTSWWDTAVWPWRVLEIQKVGYGMSSSSGGSGSSGGGGGGSSGYSGGVGWQCFV